MSQETQTANRTVECYFIHIYGEDGEYQKTVGRSFDRRGANAFVRSYNSIDGETMAVAIRQIVLADLPS